MPLAAGRARLPPVTAVAATLLLCLSCSDPAVTDASARLEALPAELDFGLAFVGDRMAKEIEVQSDSRVPVTLAALSGPEGFLIEPALVELAAGGSARVRVIFAPTGPGDVTGKLTLGGDDGRVDVKVRGGAVVRQLEAQAELDFGEVWLGREHEGAVRLVNRSPLPVTLDASLEGPASHAFHPEPGPLEVPANGTAAFGVTFAPEARGGARATLFLYPCTTCEPLEVALRGEGLLDRVVASPSALDFGAVSVGGRRVLGFNVHNLGDVERTIAYFRVVPDSLFEFEAGGHELPVDLEFGSQASFELSFTPSDTGPRAAVLQAFDEAGELVVEVPLAAVGQRLTVTAEPAALEFGPQAVGWSLKRTVKVSVAGGVLQVTAATIDGSATTFRATPARALPTPVGDPLEVEVAFAPAATGQHEAQLVLVTDDPGRPEVRVPLSGTGVVEGPCRVDVRPAELRFGLVSAGSTQRGTVAVSNVGSGQCRLTGARIDVPPGPFSLEPVEETIVVAPGGSQELAVVYAPPAGTYQSDRGTLRFTTNDTTRSLVLVTLSGTSFSGELRAIPDPVDFGTVIFGTTAFRTLELRNAGTTALIIGNLGWASGTPADFQLRNAPTLPVQLAPGAGVTLGLAMTATSAAAIEGVLEVGIEGFSAMKRVRVRGVAVVGDCGPECHTPTALCPGRVVTEVTKNVRLVGSGLDPDGDAVTCRWSLLSAPAGSHAAAQAFAPCGTAFNPDLVGDYEFELVLADPAGNQGRCVTPVHADPYTGLWLETYWDLDADVDLHLLHPAHHPGIDPFDAWSWNGTDGADCFYWSCRAGVATLSWPDSTGPEDDPSLDVDSQHLGPENIRIDLPNRTHPYWIGVHWLYNPQGHANVHVTTNVYCGGLLAATQTATLLHRQHVVLGKVDVASDGTCAFTASGTVLSY